MANISPAYSDASGTRLRLVRESVGLTRAELAERAGIALSTLYLLEDGLADLKVSTLLKVALALHVTPDYLLGLRKAA